MNISLPQWSAKISSVAESTIDLPDDVPRAAALFAMAAPDVPLWHRFNRDDKAYLLLADRSRVYALNTESAERIDSLADKIDAAVARKISRDLRLAEDAPAIGDNPPTEVPIRALSLAVAQKCNLGCTYCYAQQGDFGAPPRDMSLETALAAVNVLLRDAKPGERANLAFLGGEPLANRPVIRAASEYARSVARERGVQVTYSITTNGTLLSPCDAAFFEEFGFAVTISIDGVGDVHDRLRPFKGGRGSFQAVIARTESLLAIQRSMQVSARVTVTPRNLHLRETLDYLIDLGFHSVGFSPMLSSPTGQDQMGRQELAVMLEQMVDCGDEFQSRVIEGARYPFLNLVSALREIHRGTHRPYPCGAGAGYMGVSADGGLSACHRFVEDASGAMGNLYEGVDRIKQNAWLGARHVHRQEPCRKCWARYLCGGGCHHEVIHRGRPACDFIRGWLHYCLQSYVHLLVMRPDYFGSAL